MSDDHVGIAISGLDDLAKMFDAIGTVGTKQALGNALSKSLKPMAAEANRLAPENDEDVRPAGAVKLKGSVIIRSRLNRSQMRKRGGRREAVERFVGSTAPHALPIEFGHAIVTRDGEHVGNVPAQPFMRPAFDMHARSANRVFIGLIGKEIERVGRRYRRQAERGKLSKGARVAFKVPL